MNRKTGEASGFSLLSVVAVLGILMLLYLGAQGLNNVSKDVKGELVSAPQGSRRTACLMNRQALARMILTWTVTHPGETATIKKLQNSGVQVPVCPEGGRYSLHGQRIDCSVHKGEQAEDSES